MLLFQRMGNSMSSTSVTGRRIALLATDGFEPSELTEPRHLLEQAGADTDVIAPGRSKKIKGWSKGDWAAAVSVDVALEDASVEDYDAPVLPGG